MLAASGHGRPGRGVRPISTIAMVEAAHERGLLSCLEPMMSERESTPESITQQTAIADADRLLSIGPVSVPPTDTLEHLAELAVENAACRVLSVVDPDGRLVGLVPIRVLVNDIFLKVVPEEFLGEIVDYEAVLKYAAHVGARTSGDIMLPPVSVHPEETVRDAFQRMHEHRLNGLPITDAREGVVGYIDQLELLLVWLRATGRSRLLRPDRHPEHERQADR
jgi:CBS domain-containing protein